jgi:hypothetical protein
MGMQQRVNEAAPPLGNFYGVNLAATMIWLGVLF